MSIFGNTDPQQEQLDQLKKLATEQTLKRLQTSIDNLNRAMGHGSNSSSTNPTTAVRNAAQSLDTLRTAADRGRAAMDAHSRTSAEIGRDAINTSTAQQNAFLRVAGSIKNSSSFMAKSYVDMAKRGSVSGQMLEKFGTGLWNVAGKFPVIGAIVIATYEVLASYAKAMNQGLDVYRQLSQKGMALGTNLLDAAVMAADANIGLREFTGIMSNASETVASAFGNAYTGAQKFAELSMTFNSSSKQLGKELRALGYSNEQIMEGATLFYDLNKDNHAVQTMNANDQATATANLLKEIDSYSVVTGKERKAVQARMQDVARQYSTQATVMNFAENQRQNIIKSMGMISETLGTAGKDLFQNVLDGRGYSQAAKDAMGAVPGLMEMFVEDKRRLEQGFQSQIDNNAIINHFQSLTEDQMKEFNNRARIAALHGDQTLMDLYGKALEVRRINMSKEAIAERELAKERASYWAEITNGISSIWNKITKFGTRVFSELNKMFGGNLIEQAVSAVDGFFSKENMDWAAKEIAGLIRSFINLFKDVKFEDIKKTVIGFWNSTVDFFKNTSSIISGIWMVISAPFKLAAALGEAIGTTIAYIIGCFIDVGVDIYRAGQWLYSNSGAAFDGIAAAIQWMGEKWDALTEYMKPLGDALANFGKAIAGMIEKMRSWMPSWMGGTPTTAAPTGAEANINSQLDAAIRAGSVPSLNGGGIVSGPSSGYISLMHGTEAVVPLPQGMNSLQPQPTNSAATADLLNSLSEQAGSTEDVAKLLEQILAALSRMGTDMTDLVTQTREVNNNTRSTSIALR